MNIITKSLALIGLALFLFNCGSEDPLGPDRGIGNYNSSPPPVSLENGEGNVEMNLIFALPQQSNAYSNYILEVSHLHIYYQFDERNYNVFFGDINSANSRQAEDESLSYAIDVPLRSEVHRLNVDYEVKAIVYTTSGVNTNRYMSPTNYKVNMSHFQADSQSFWFLPDTNSVYVSE